MPAPPRRAALATMGDLATTAGVSRGGAERCAQRHDRRGPRRRGARRRDLSAGPSKTLTSWMERSGAPERVRLDPESSPPRLRMVLRASAWNPRRDDEPRRLPGARGWVWVLATSVVARTAVAYRPIQYVALTRNTLSGRSPNSARVSRRKSKSPNASLPAAAASRRRTSSSRADTPTATPRCRAASAREVRIVEGERRRRTRAVRIDRVLRASRGSRAMRADVRAVLALHRPSAARANSLNAL